MIQQLLNIAKRTNHTVYYEPYKLNIWGIRADTNVPNKFDDTIFVFWKTDKGNWDSRKYYATTDTGTYYLNNLMDSLGAALLKEGQYLDSYKRGAAYRNGSLLPFPYELQQVKAVTIYRDYNRDAVLDFFNGRETTGIYGINIHVGANKGGKSLSVDNWSAGCQVLGDYNEYAEFDSLQLKHISLYGNSFSYTLIDERARKRAKKRLIFNTMLGIIAVVMVAYVIYTYFSKKNLLK